MTQNIPFLPLHIVEQILLNLDPQTLIKCSVVCKDWRSLVTSPAFISHHADRTLDSKTEVLLLKICLRKETESSFFQETYSLRSDNDQFDLLRTMERPPINLFNMVGTSNGLVCLADNLYCKFILWNPSIQKYAWLPRLLITLDEENRYVGFGFDRRSNDFKVVSLVERKDKIDATWVFSYATWSWKRLTDSTPPPCWVLLWTPPVSINGVLHWIAWHIVGHYKFVLTFDLTHEVFGEISLSDSMARESSTLISIVATGDDSLAVSQEKYTWFGQVWSVCVMKQYGVHKSWANVITELVFFHNIQWQELIIPRNVLAIRKNWDIILEMQGGQILRYNPTTTATTNVLEAADLGVIIDSVFIGYHVESLYLLEKLEDVISYHTF